MKIVIAGGTGHIGGAMVKHFSQQGHQVVVLSRKANATGVRTVVWDGVSLGDWAQEINESDVPTYWEYSIRIAKNWEKALFDSEVPRTRKVALRTAMVMGRHSESVFGVLKKMTKLRLGGSIGGGKQFVSWIHEDDFLRAIDFLIQHQEIDGVVNMCAPNPIPQKEFMKNLRQALHVKIGLPATAWMAEIGAFFLRTDTELLLKSRRVVPTRLLQSGFQFRFTSWDQASEELVKQTGAAL